MLSILLGHSFFLRFDSKQAERAKPYPPLATLQVGAALRQAGHQVALFDAMLAESTRPFNDQLRRIKPELVLLYEDNFNYLSKMCLGKMRVAACEMIASARRAGARVIVSGSDISDAPEVYLRAGADVVLIGEGLAALSDLLTRLSSRLDMPNAELIESLSGVGSLVDDRLVVHAQVETTSPALARASASAGTQLITLQGKSPTSAPPLEATTAWDLLDVERYRKVWMKAHGRFSLNMAASKGCSFRCAWCAKPIWGNRYQQRSAAAVAAEMAHLKRDLRPDHIWFADDIFGFRADWVNAFAQALRGEGGGVPFTIQSRADLITVAMAQALKDAGCQEVWIGAESGSQRVLDAMNKGTMVEEILTARARLKAQGIRVGFFIQLGYLNEELEDLIATRRLIDQARPDDIGVSVSYPLPGTKFYEQVKEQLGGKTRWDDSNDLAMMFKGTYSSEFYRAVRDLLHQWVDLEKLNESEGVAGYRKGRTAVLKRWRALMTIERKFRTQTLPFDAAKPTCLEASS